MNFGRYQVEKKLGEDPLGDLYLVSTADKGGERSVLRLLRANLCRDPELEKRCLDLVHAIRLLPLPELVRPLAVGRLSDGRIYLTSEHVEAPTLRERLSGGPLPPHLAIHVGQALGQVLAAAHKKGLAHLGLRPECVHVVDGGQRSGAAAATAPGGSAPRVRLQGLGLARLVRVRPEPSAAPYLAPELTAGPGQGGAPADVFALGSMLYEMLTGRNRLQAEGGSGAPPIPVDRLLPALGKGLSVLLQAMQAKDPAQRPLMGDVADRLAQLEESLLIGQHVGAYKIVSKIAQGGMGTVFRGMNEQIGRSAAIKVLRAQFAQAPEVAKRFLNEARAVNLIRHPNLVEIYEFGELPNGQPYLVMELLSGESLEARRQKRGGTLPEPEALGIVRQVAVATAAAHRKGVVHRDLKPDNVMIVPDPVAPGGERVKLLDFGIAKVSVVQQGGGEDATLVNTHAGALMGTPGYMAPEQLSGAGGVTDKTDVYALGAILYELLSGKRPQDAAQERQAKEPTSPGGSPMGDPPPLREIAPAVSQDTAALCTRMLSFLPGERPGMASVAELLEPALPAPEPLGEEAAEGKPAGRRRLLVVLGAGGLMALSTAVALWTGSPGQPAQPTPPAEAGKDARAVRQAVPGAPQPVAEVVAPGPPPKAAEARQAPAAPAPSPAPAPALDEGTRQALRSRALEVLTAGLQGTPAERVASLRALAAGAQGAAAARPLIEPLVDPAAGDPKVQGQAARTLAELVAGTKEAAEVTPRIVQLVEKTTDGGTFVDAADALDRLGDPRGKKRLKEALQSRDVPVRRAAAQVLAERGDREGARALGKSLAGATEPERIVALGVLAKRGDAAARGQLGALLTTGEPKVRLLAAARLAELGDETGRATLSQAMGRQDAQQALAARGLAGLKDEPACAALRAVLSGGRSEVGEAGGARQLAAEGLGDCGAAADAPLLGKLLKEDAPLRTTAAGAILRLLR